MQESLSSSRVVAHNAFYNLAGYAASAAYVFFIIPIIVGYLGVQQFGLWSLMLALAGYVGLADLGLSTSFVKYIAEFVSLNEQTKVNRVIQLGATFYVLLTIVLLIVGWLAFPFVFGLLKVPQEQYSLGLHAFLLSLLNFGVGGVSGVLAGTLAGFQRSDLFNRLLAVSYLARFVVILLVLANGGGLLGLIAADMAVGGALIIPLWFSGKKHCPGISLRFAGYDHQLMKSLLRFGLQLQISRFAELVQAQFDKLLITRYVSLGSVSMYDFGSRPLGRIRSLPLTAVSALVPAVSSLQAEQDADRIFAAFVRGTRYILAFGLPVFALCVCFAHELIFVWLGPGFDAAALTIQILAPGYFVSVVAGVLALVSQGKGEPKVQMYAMMIQAVVNIGLSFALITSFGFFGAVSGTSVSAVLGGLLFFRWYGKRLTDRPLSLLLRLASKPFLSIVPAAVAGMGIVAVMHASGYFDSRTATLLAVMAGSVAFLLLYGLMLVVSKALTPDDKEFFKKTIPGRFVRLSRQHPEERIP